MQWPRQQPDGRPILDGAAAVISPRAYTRAADRAGRRLRVAAELLLGRLAGRHTIQVTAELPF